MVVAGVNLGYVIQVNAVVRAFAYSYKSRITRLICTVPVTELACGVRTPGPYAAVIAEDCAVALAAFNVKNVSEVILIKLLALTCNNLTACVV